MLGLSPEDFEDCPRDIPDARVVLIGVISSNLPDISFLSRTSSNHQIMIIVEASGNLGFFETSSVRIKCTSFAIHEKMSPKVLNDVDEIVVELGLVISNRIVITIEFVINVWCESLESFWNRTCVKRLSTPVSQIPKHH